MLRGVLLVTGFLLAMTAGAQPPAVLIGLDAAFGHSTNTAAEAIRRGMAIAIAEVNADGGVLGGRPLRLEVRDNRSITAIGVDNLRELAALPDLVAVFGGKYSPVFVECLPLVHELGIPLLDPWGSADQIIDHAYRPSYTFRLSLKDAWAAPKMLDYAVSHFAARRVGLLLPNTAWGRSNRADLHRAARAREVEIVAEHWYNWDDHSMLRHYREILASGAQALVLVSNESDSAQLLNGMLGLQPAQRLPVVSHWGATGGRLPDLAGAALVQLDYTVVQTFSFIGRHDPVAQRVLAALSRDYGVQRPERVISPVGLAQAYDLVHLLARAIQRAGSTDRARIRDALEQLGPYQGLVRYYQRPFTPQRHEALSAAQVFMARYRADGSIVPVGH